MCRAELSESVENVDMSLEELQQLLLRSHQQSAVETGAGAVMDVSRCTAMVNGLYLLALNLVQRTPKYFILHLVIYLFTH